METPQTKARCEACGGACCKRMPGEYSPEDFRVQGNGALDWDRIEGLLREGLAQIDWWEGASVAYYLRAAVTRDFRDGHRVFHGAWGGACVYLANTGCAIHHDARPKGCRELEPRGDKCVSAWNKEAAKDAWAPYAERLAELGRRIEEDEA